MYYDYLEDYLEDEVTCDSCGYSFFTTDKEVYRGMCHECAENKYTDTLGLEFISDFPTDFLAGYWDIDLKGKDDLRDILHEIFIKAVTSDIELGRTSTEREALKKYCLHDNIEYWIDFLCDREDDNGLF